MNRCPECGWWTTWQLVLVWWYDDASEMAARLSDWANRASVWLLARGLSHLPRIPYPDGDVCRRCGAEWKDEQDNA